MNLSSKAWNNYISKLRKCNAAAANAMLEYITAHGLDDIDAVIQYGYSLITRYGEASSALAAEMYDATAALAAVTVPAAIPAETSSYGEVTAAVKSSAKYLNPNTIANTVARLVKQAGADTTAQNAVRDGAEWAWVPSGDSCAFCIALASRGWETASQKALKGNHAQHIHANCDCTYAIRFDGESKYESYDPAKYKEIYDNASDGNSYEKINAIRREKYKTNGDTIREQKRIAYAEKKNRENAESLKLYKTNGKHLVGAENVDEISKEEARKKLLGAIERVNEKNDIDKRKSENIINSIANKLGVDKQNISIGSLPVESQELCLGAVRQSINHFPKLRGHFKSIIYDSTLNATAQSDSLAGKVLLSERFKDLQNLKKWYDFQVKLGFFAKGTSVDSIVMHEIGHQLDGLFTLKGLMGGSINRYGVIRTSSEVKKTVLTQLGFYDRMKELRAQYKAQGYTGEKLMHAMDFECREFITEQVSTYAAENEREFFAECFSEYMTSGEPRKAAKIFGEIIEKLYGEIK